MHAEVAEERAERLVGLEPAPVDGHKRHPDRRPFERGAKAKLALP